MEEDSSCTVVVRVVRARASEGRRVAGETRWRCLCPTYCFRLQEEMGATYPDVFFLLGTRRDGEVPGELGLIRGAVLIDFSSITSLKVHLG